MHLVHKFDNDTCTSITTITVVNLHPVFNMEEEHQR